MQKAPHIHLRDVQAVYAGAEGRLWNLLMGAQIHVGGLNASIELANLAGIGPNQRGVDLCCASGGGMRFLLRFRDVAHMTGVDATPEMLAQARQRLTEEGFNDRSALVQADVCASGLPDASMDFVWGEDAWCYVEDKEKLIAETARLAKAGGAVAFTDWMEGSIPMSTGEARRCLGFMKFPALLGLAEYEELLGTHGCQTEAARDTGRFAPSVRLYIDMIEKQLTYDALKIIAFDQDLAATLLEEMRFMQSLAEAGKIIQGLVVARKKR
jgi:ubiquinone/menaquinone biosynthesis C-methylase UbiE